MSEYQQKQPSKEHVPKRLLCSLNDATLCCAVWINIKHTVAYTARRVAVCESINFAFYYLNKSSKRCLAIIHVKKQLHFYAQ